MKWENDSFGDDSYVDPAGRSHLNAIGADEFTKDLLADMRPYVTVK